MTSHAHILLHRSEIGLSRFMRRLPTGYANALLTSNNQLCYLIYNENRLKLPYTNTTTDSVLSKTKKHLAVTKYSQIHKLL